MKMSKESSSFLVTKEYKRFKEFCEACKREKYIGLCYGTPGVGKTLSARYYSSWDHIEFYKRFNALQKKSPTIVPYHLKDHDIIFYTAEVNNSPARLQTSLTRCIEKMVDIRYDAHFCHSSPYQEFSDDDYSRQRICHYTDSQKPFVRLLLVDESDRLKMPSLEQLRDFYDHNKCGLIFIGVPGMEKKFSRYSQVYSRIGFVHEFTSLGQEEMIFIMRNHMQTLSVTFKIEDFTDSETIAAIV